MIRFAFPASNSNWTQMRTLKRTADGEDGEKSGLKIYIPFGI